MSTPKARARWLRGALVAVCSAVTTVAAHAAAGGALPQGAALTIAALLCTAAGAAVGAMRLEGRRAGSIGVIAALAGAQLLGHLALAVADGHHHDAGLTPSMTATHAGAAIALGTAIAAVEYLYVVCASVLCWLRLFACAAVRPPARAVHWFTDVVAAQAVLLRSGLGMRAPPLVVVAAG